jgi:hypothetical protein
VYTVFKSRDHPKGRPKGYVYTKALARPIGACTAPLMIGATAAALQGELILGYLLWGLPSALVVASLWTHFRLSSTPAELHLRSGQVAVQSIQDVLLDRDPSWHSLHKVKVGPEYTELSMGWTTRICRRSNWPEYEKLREAAQQAFPPH